MVSRRRFLVSATLLVTAVVVALSLITATARASDGKSHHWQTVTASFYGPGFYGGTTRCGTPYTRSSINVAVGQRDRRWRCGQKVDLRFRGRTVRGVPVLDTGSFDSFTSRTFDLSGALYVQLGYLTDHPLEWRHHLKRRYVRWIRVKRRVFRRTAREWAPKWKPGKGKIRVRVGKRTKRVRYWVRAR